MTLRLLWFGDISSTGFGSVTMDCGREFVKQGVDIRFLSQNDFDELGEPFASRTLDIATYTHAQPDGTDLHGGVTGVRDFLPKLLDGTSEGLHLANGEPWGDWKPDAVFLLGDFYGLRLMVIPHLEAFRSLPAFHYVPIEGAGLPPLWNEVWSIIKPIAMTRFGQAQIAKVTGYEPPMVYHGVDTDVFHPVSVETPVIVEAGMQRAVLTSKAECKAFFGLNPAITLILRTDRNMPRKGYPALLRAMEPVLMDRPLAALALHCRAWDQGGFLPDSVSKMLPSVQSRVMVPDLGAIPREALVAMYNAADLYVSTSAEGFGLTIAEALACGVACVGLDYSAVPEVIGPGGRLVPVGAIFDNEYAHEWALPDEAAFSRTVARLLDNPNERERLARRGPVHVRESFRWDLAARDFTAIAQDALKAAQEPHSDPAVPEGVPVPA